MIVSACTVASSRSRTKSNKKNILKIKIPKSSKLSSFFNKPTNQIYVSGASKQIHDSHLKQSRANSMKSLEGPILTRRFHTEASHPSLETKVNIELSTEKDVSNTRSRLTVNQEYGLCAQNRGVKKNILGPKTLRVFPISSKKQKGKMIPKPPKKMKSLKESQSSPSLEYTFGIEGFSVALKNKKEQ